MTAVKVMAVFGTRPEAIKMAPVVKSLDKDKRIETIVTVSAQHREMLDQVLELFEIKPDYDLDIMAENQSLSDITSRVLKGLEGVIQQEEPDLILVHGDTTTTFVGALASFYQQVKIGHVEAGLRTNDKYSPFPEEMNRHLTGVLADLHFAPTELSRQNLLEENIPAEDIFITGNTVIDALLDTVQKDYIFNNSGLNEIEFNKGKTILLTAHRRENLGKPMENIFAAIREIVKKDEEVKVIFPVHLNPRVRETVDRYLKGLGRVHLIEPLDYRPFVNLMARSDLILTDSGGIQEEAPALGKPVLVLREKTERPEAIKAGTVRRVGTDKNTIIKITEDLLNNEKLYNQMANAINPYGDGKAGQRILKRILYEYGFNDTPGEEFRGG